MHLPTAVDLREVGLRNGLQMEAPVPTEAKLRVLDAFAATGVQRVEVTSFVSPRAVPALCPFDVATPVERVVDIARCAVDRGADRLCLGDTTSTPCCVPRASSRRLSATRWPAASTGLAAARAPRSRAVAS